MTETTSPDFHALLQRLDAQDAEIQRLQALVEPTDKGKDRVRSRRDMLKLAGAAALGAAGAAALRAVPAAAANGDTITVGGTFTGTLPTQLTNTAGDALYLTAASSSVGLWANGTGSSVAILGTSANGAGVLGRCDGPGSGGNAVKGLNFNASGVGVSGIVSNSGAVNGYGVLGNSNTTSGIGISGSADASGGLGGYFTGGRAPINLAPTGSAGPPVSNAHSVGDIWADSSGILWACITAGTPGVFVPLQTGGANLTHFVKVSNKQYPLANSDGVTWVDMDATGLAQVITPAFNAQAVISVSADLWTANPGVNQDIGIFISGGAYGAGQIVAWKESGGFAGTFSPNAAFVETTQPFVAGTPYTIKARWKANKSAVGATIFAGAGPLPAGSAGGGVAGQYSPTRLATHLVVDVPSPITLRIPANDPTKTPPPPAAMPSRP
jgi:hypothetical protein